VEGALGLQTKSEPDPFTSTAFPAGIAVAANLGSGGRASVGASGGGQEMRAIWARHDSGPNGEYSARALMGKKLEGYGEDPYLAASRALRIIKGVQGEGVIATVKHFDGNNRNSSAIAWMNRSMKGR